jgi:hypothetical protein
VPDELVERVLRVWTPRFLRVGIIMEDLAELTERIDTWDDWCPEWIKTAQVHEQLAEKWLASGDELSAAEAFQRASIYYHVAAFVYFRDLALHDYGYKKMVETYERSLPLCGGAIEKVRFPFEDIELVGLVSTPNGVESPPVVILIPGLDSSKGGTPLGAGRLPRARHGRLQHRWAGPGGDEPDDPHPAGLRGADRRGDRLPRGP